MKRRVLIVIVCLLLGAIINVAVAWSVVAFAPIESRSCALQGTTKRATDADRAWWNEHKPIDFASDPQLSSSFHFLGVNAKLLTADRQADAEFMFDDSGALYKWITHRRRTFVWDNGLVVEAGWPLPALQGARWAVDAYGNQMHIAAVAEWQTTADELHRFAIPWHRGKIRFILPCAPMLAGFAANSCFYAAVAWLLFSFAIMLRRRHRIKRGLCPACAYPIGESDICTECGRAVR